jgi:hypothetical protein
MESYLLRQVAFFVEDDFADTGEDDFTDYFGG